MMLRSEIGSAEADPSAHEFVANMAERWVEELDGDPFSLLQAMADFLEEVAAEAGQAH